MKHKFSSMGRVAIALVLALSLSLVMAVPVAAEPDVSDVSVAVNPTVVTAEAQYTITFTVNVGLYTPGNVIIISFPDDTVVPATIPTTAVHVADLTDVESDDAIDVEVDGQKVKIWVPLDIEFEHEAEVVFDGPPGGAGIVNPMEADSYCFQVNTDEEPNPVDVWYDITEVPGPVDLYDTEGAVNLYIGSYDDIIDAIDDTASDTADPHFIGPDDTDWLIVAHAGMGPGAGGEYSPFSLEGYDDVTVRSNSKAVVKGAQVVNTSYKANDVVDNVVFVNDSTSIVLQDLDIQGDGLGDNPEDLNMAVVYDRESTGEITDCIVSPNTIGDMKSLGIAILDGSNVTIDPTLVENFGRVGIYIRGEAVIAETTIIGQVYTEEGIFCYGVEVEEAPESTASEVIIRDSEIYNCDSAGYCFVDGKIVAPIEESAGVYINGYRQHEGSWEDNQVIIKRTKIHDNFVGIWVVNSYNSHACFNDIYDNRMYGVYSVEDYDKNNTLFDATRNYWGDPSGPSTGDDRPGLPTHRFWPRGTGDAITGSHSVRYMPWLTYPYADVVDESAQWYGGAYTVNLGSGWNTLSTPVPLDARADQLGEIVALGGWMQNYLLGYSYDPVGGWQLLTGDYQLLPCSAIYVLMSDKDLFPCLKKGEFYIPTKDVPEGWNLVSLNSDHDMPTRHAFASIETMPGFGGYSQVISPPTPNQMDWIWSPLMGGGGLPVSPGWGYWVYMTGDGTLAGYLMTPQYLTEDELDFLECNAWEDPPELLYPFPWD